MVLIVDSGSTKCDWIAVDNNGKQLFDKIRTPGLNPAILKEGEIKKILKASKELSKINSEVTHVFFYGAGCGTEKPRVMLTHVLQFFFINAEVEVQEDTMAAVRATLNHDDEAAVVCILGTGSNCSYYDGEKLHQRVVSLGYIIMDDASGNYYGKQLIRDYYYNQMPDNIRVAFASRYNLEQDYIKFNIYKKPNANAYLATFAEFMFLNKDSEYMRNLIRNGLRLFTKNMILQYKEEIKTVPVHFAGSIAYFCQEEIKEIAKEFNFKVGNFSRRPIEGLVIYHTKNL